MNKEGMEGHKKLYLISWHSCFESCYKVLKIAEAVIETAKCYCYLGFNTEVIVLSAISFQ